MKADAFRFDGRTPCDLSRLPTDAGGEKGKKDEYAAKTAANLRRMEALQEALYADGREGLVILLQALDAAGKDGTIKHVMGGLNPQGVTVYNFKQPTRAELQHDYLWRVGQCLPPRGGIAIFNRSYYEDVLVVRMHGLQKTYRMADRVLEDDEAFFRKRYRQIRHFEEYLYGKRLPRGEDIPEPFQRKTERAFSGAHPGGGEELEIFPGGYPGTGLLERLYGRLRGGRKRDGYPPQSVVCDPG